MAKEQKYTIPPTVFLQTWLDAVTADPKKTMAEFIVILKAKCDNLEHNMGAKERNWSESSLNAKMDYYRRSYECDILKPKMQKGDSVDARAMRRDKFTKLFIEAGVATKKDKK